MFPLQLNLLSEGELVAGTQRYFFATWLNAGKLTSWFLHHFKDASITLYTNWQQIAQKLSFYCVLLCACSGCCRCAVLKVAHQRFPLFSCGWHCHCCLPSVCKLSGQAAQANSWPDHWAKILCFSASSFSPEMYLALKRGSSKEVMSNRSLVDGSLYLLLR